MLWERLQLFLSRSCFFSVSFSVSFLQFRHCTVTNPSPYCCNEASSGSALCRRDDGVVNWWCENCVDDGGGYGRLRCKLVVNIDDDDDECEDEEFAKLEMNVWFEVLDCEGYGDCI
jgi:hypothetical protein